MSPLVASTLVWAVPVLAALGLCLRPPWSARRAGAALLSTTWCAWSLLVVAALGVETGAWSFEGGGPSVAGVPAGVWLGWTALWGPVALLTLGRAPLWVVVVTAAWLDLHVMPMLPGLRLGDGWLWAALLALAVALVPAQLLGRWTLEDRRLYPRVALHMVQFGAIMLVGLPGFALSATGASLGSHPVLWVQALSVACLPGLAAVLEFATRGGGTPVPFDPPRRLVVTGPYAYVANPMQVSFALYALVLAAWTASPAVAAMALMAGAFSGFGRWSEADDMARFPGWAAYRANVRHWIPRWRPWVPSPAILYVSADCAACQQLQAWLSSWSPTGLRFVAAEDHPTRGLTRLTWAPAEGPEVEGIAALGRALEHLDLGWAVMGMGLRLPGVRHLATLLGDAVGAGPRQVIWRGRVG